MFAQAGQRCVPTLGLALRSAGRLDGALYVVVHRGRKFDGCQSPALAAAVALARLKLHWIGGYLLPRWLTRVRSLPLPGRCRAPARYWPAPSMSIH
jgi:hypothetical protein